MRIFLCPLTFALAAAALAAAAERQPLWPPRPWPSPENIPEAAEKYFSTIAAEVKAAMPNHLYHGCRLVRF